MGRMDRETCQLKYHFRCGGEYFPKKMAVFQLALFEETFDFAVLK